MKQIKVFPQDPKSSIYNQEVILPIELKKPYRQFIKQRLQEMVNQPMPSDDIFGLKRSQHAHQVYELERLLKFLGKRDQTTPSHQSMTGEAFHDFIATQPDYQLSEPLITGFRFKIKWESPTN